MKNFLITAALLLVIFLACKTKINNNDLNGNQSTKELKLDFIAKSNSKVSGTASFIETDGKVTFAATISGLTPGVHAIHIHEKGDCSSEDGKSAGGHWNPTFKEHGKWGSDSYHKGDIGNFTTDEFGNGTVTMTTDEWCIGCGDATKDIAGKGLIVHQDPDDLVSQPAGNAGDRVACTAIIR